MTNDSFLRALFSGIQDEKRPTNDPDEVISLPDIRDELKRKKVEEKIAAMELEKEESKPKIKRSDTEAFKKVSSTRKTFSTARVATSNAPCYPILTASGTIAVQRCR